ncbi:hypothetical protein EJ110_NYTH49568 [Nymphaea thermarum]|nr:hypothetical protein EJ110_NYTH49568 [Nymphaea thermarum]
MSGLSVVHEIWGDPAVQLKAEDPIQPLVSIGCKIAFSVFESCHHWASIYMSVVSFFLEYATMNLMESLILAQDECWRDASHMQVGWKLVSPVAERSYSTHDWTQRNGHFWAKSQWYATLVAYHVPVRRYGYRYGGTFRLKPKSLPDAFWFHLLGFSFSASVTQNLQRSVAATASATDDRWTTTSNGGDGSGRRGHRRRRLEFNFEGDEDLDHLNSELNEPCALPELMASKLHQLRSKVAAASQFASKHGCAYYKQLMEQNKKYVVEPPTVEKCNELSKQLFYTRLASLPGRYESFWKELDAVKQLWKNRHELRVEDAGIAALFGLECYCWFCAGEIVGRGFTITGYHV